MKIDDAIKHALNGEAILFLGAGFSIGGKNRLNKPLLDATDLSYEMCKKLGINESDDLPLISERFIKDPKIGKGLAELINFLKDNLICTSSSEIQDTILSIPWLRIYTTNYDNIAEISSKKQSKNREVITATLPKYNVDHINGAIVHINGNIINITSEKFYEEFKITNGSYLKQGFLNSDWGTQFIHDINNCKSIIFIGYSMKYDLELQKVMHKKINDKAIFISRETIDENQEYLFNTWGTLYKIGASGFSKEINEIKKTFIPHIRVDTLKSFKELTISDYINTKILSKDVLNLLTYGDYNKFYFRSNDYYFIKRKDSLNNVKSLLKTHKICIIHSNFGNGKSIFLDYLASRLVEENNIYYLENDKFIQDDLRIIFSHKTSSNILLVDNYDLHMNLFKELSFNFPDNLKVIATSRTSISDILIDRLETEYNFKSDVIAIENIEILSYSERKQLINLLDKYHFWGTNSNMSYREKNKLINNKYHNRLSEIFYMLLDSKIIENKLDDILGAIKHETLKKYLIVQAICNICNFKLKAYEIAMLSDISISEIEKLSFSGQFREIFIKTADDVELRSSVFSQYIVRNIEDYSLMSQTLKIIYINSLNSNRNEYLSIQKKLISRSNLIEIFGGKKRNTSWEKRDREIYEFYNDIQDYAKENPFYWLQIAITSLNLCLYADAKIYFENAYAYAELLEGFDCFQLDTHYARFLFTKITNANSFDFDTFFEAHRLLMDNSNAETRLSYVLRQASSYYYVDQKFSNSFSADTRLKFIKCLNEVILKFEKYFNAIERKKKDSRNNFFFAIDKPVRESYKYFRKILLDTIPIDEVIILDKQYNNLVNKTDKVNPGKVHAALSLA